MTQHTVWRVRLGLVVLACACSAVRGAAQPSPSAARPEDGRGFHGWQFEAHLGVIPSTTASGTSQLPPAGTTFTTFNGTTSRLVPSWYFGDGALLANQVAQAVMRNNPGLQLPQIVALDPALKSAGVTRQSAAAFGFRIGHSVTRHALVELSVDVGNSRTAITSDTLKAIEATRASFGPYFSTVLGTLNTNAANVTTGSTASIENNNTGSQINGVLDVNVSPGTYGGFMPYFTLGGGVIIVPADAPAVTLSGNYAFTINQPGTGINGARLAESDNLHIKYEVNPIRPTLVAGAGVERAVTGHSGFRADLRFYLNANQTTVRIDAGAQSGVGAPPLGRLNRGPSPALQFSTIPSVPSSLSPQATVRRFNTFVGHAAESSITVGYFVRF
ncbi:MAG TPA: hypothetical protein VL309_07395 [Vicinamibacterales bacterium]|jgi:hypothetical protein|nr:hypothetical protein [Vicinamibacterales bacterium]